MSIAEKLTIVAENCEKVLRHGYDWGRDDGASLATDDLVAAITISGVRTIFSYAFSRTNFDNLDVLYFKNPIVPTGAIDRMFYIYYGKTIPNNIDLSQVPTSAGCQALFMNSKLTTIRDVGLPAMNNYLNVFAGCANLVTIEKLRAKKSTIFSQTFNGCSALQNITFEGEIGQNISFSDCSKLTYKSLMSIINALYNYSGSGITHTLTLHADAKARLSDSEKVIATQKGWTIA